MYWVWVVFIIAALQLQHMKALPVGVKNKQLGAQMMHWNNIIKRDFTAHGFKKELNFDMGLSAIRSKRALNIGEEEFYIEKEEAISKRKKRAVNGVPEAAPCYKGGGGGGGTMDSDVAARRGSQKKSKVSAKAKSILKKKKKLVADGDDMQPGQDRKRRDVKDFMEKARSSVRDAMAKVENFFKGFSN